MAPYTLPLREALNDSVSSGRFADTKITLFSRRDSSGTVCKPRALYASSHVLRTVPYFNDRKFPSTLLNGDPANDTFQVLFGTFAESESRDFPELLDGAESAENYGYYLDSDLEEDEDSADSKLTRQIVPARGHFFDPFCFLPRDDNPVPPRGEHKENLETGKVIKIQDVAFIT